MNIHNAIKVGQRANATAKPVTTTDSQPTPPPTKPSAIIREEVIEKPALKSVDISVAGTPHRIICPSDEVQHVEQASKFINDKIREIRNGTTGKNPTNEELLVLTCLELYDQLQQLKADRQIHLIENERAKTLIDRMTKDARSVL